MLEVAEVGHAIPKQEYEARVPDLRVELLNAQFDLQRAPFSVIVTIAGDDRPALNQLLVSLNEWLDGRYLQTRVFGYPSEEELERPPLWRFWRAMPSTGEIGLFVGGWARSAVALRMDEKLGAAEFERRLEHLERLETALANDDVLLLKFWLHLSGKQHRKRLRKAGKDGVRRMDPEDVTIAERFEEATPHIETLLQRTHTAQAPWQVVETSDSRYMRLTVAESLLLALRTRLEQPPPTPLPGPATPVPSSSTVTVLDRVDLASSLDPEAYKKELDKQQARLGALSLTAREQKVSSILVFEGWDAAGKGGVIRRVTRPLEPGDYRVIPIAAPTDEENAHHYLWRFWRQLGRAGSMLIFDRSWYGRVLVERIEGLAREDEWRRAYTEINDFESQLVEFGIPVLKFWLHIDAEEQMRRFQAREKTPYKKYKITDEDYRNRERWDDYVRAVDDMVAQTSTPAAPWHLVPANDKRTARVEVLKEVCSSLKAALKGAG